MILFSTSLERNIILNKEAADWDSMYFRIESGKYQLWIGCVQALDRNLVSTALVVCTYHRYNVLL